MNGRAATGVRNEDREHPLEPCLDRRPNDWTRDEISELFKLPFDELVFRAHMTHRAYCRSG